MDQQPHSTRRQEYQDRDDLRGYSSQRLRNLLSLRGEDMSMFAPQVNAEVVGLRRPKGNMPGTIVDLEIQIDHPERQRVNVSVQWDSALAKERPVPVLGDKIKVTFGLPEVVSGLSS